MVDGVNSLTNITLHTAGVQSVCITPEGESSTLVYYSYAQLHICTKSAYYLYLSRISVS